MHLMHMSVCNYINSRGSPSAISIAVIPSDHWSLCVQRQNFISTGTTYNGDRLPAGHMWP